MSEVKTISKPESLIKQGVKTIPDLFEFGSKQWSRHTAFRKKHPWGYQSITYEEFNRLISFLGAGLIRRGLSTGDKVILIASNSPEWPLVYGAVTSAGGVVVPLDPSLAENDIRHLLMHSGSRFLVTDPEIYLNRIRQMHLKQTRVILIEEGNTDSEVDQLGEIMAEGKESINDGESAYFKRRTAVSGDDEAAICYTSGATGSPKGVVLLHRNIISNIESIRNTIPIIDNDNFLCMLPLYHTFSTTCAFLTPLACGASVVFCRSLKPNSIIEDILNEEISVLIAVPLIFEHMLEKIGKKGKKESDQDKGTLSRLFIKIRSTFNRLLGRKKAGQSAGKVFSSIRVCISGAAPLRPDIENALLASGLSLLQGYGLTEASPVVSVNPPDRVKPGTVGPPLSGVEVTIDSPDENGIGEVVVEGPNVMKGYFNNPEETSRVLKNGRLYTGDLGKLDNDGYLTIKGRKKSVIVTAGGKNIYPAELESRLEKSEYVLECAVIPAQDRRGNSRPAAIIVPDYDALDYSVDIEKPLTDGKVRDIIAEQVGKVNAQLPDYKRISEFQITDGQLPRTTTNKLKRHMISWIRE
ncbi:MAG: AMP-binding protein [Candidatus Latescibacteria bacterium]|nr:AMP-binding protein [bacterium]MBD3424537.1 AMP-binding protein [Candidatus Latescibacterota bacterium]